MSLDLGSLVASLELDDSKWDSRLDSADAALRNFQRQSVPRARAAGTDVGEAVGDGMADGIQDAEPEIRSAGEDAGQAAGDGMLTKGKAGALAAAAVVGAAFVEALDVSAANDKLAASLGSSPRIAERYGKAASNLYSEAWGDSLDQVNQAIAGVVRNIGGMRRASRRDLEDVTAGVLDIVAAFDQDLPMATAAAGQLVRTGLAEDVNDALDIITVGLQGPANKADDFLETINEYGTQFRKLGLDGRDVVDLLNDGVRAGARDSDVAADALKEFSLRATGPLWTVRDVGGEAHYELTALGEAFNAAGYNALDADPKMARMAETLQRDIAGGGEKARDGLQILLDGVRGVEDPLARSQTAVALFGTQAEDLGDALYAMDLDKPAGEMDRVTGAASRMSEQLNGNTKTDLKSFSRTVKMNVVDFLEAEVIPAIEDFADSDLAEGMWDDLKDAGKELRPLVDEILPALGIGLGVAGDALGVVAPLLTEVFEAFNKLPPELQATLLLGGGAVAVGKKLAGSKSALGVAGGVASRATPVPVWVVNGGLPGPGPGPGKPGAPKVPGGKSTGILGFLAGFPLPALAALGADQPDIGPALDTKKWVSQNLPKLPTQVNDAWSKVRGSMIQAQSSADQTRAKFDNLFDTLEDVDKSDPTVSVTARGLNELLGVTRTWDSLLDDLDGRVVRVHYEAVVDKVAKQIGAPNRSPSGVDGEGLGRHVPTTREYNFYEAMDLPRIKQELQADEWRASADGIGR